ncbi:MAG: NADH:ubiquinone reductase (Na(+)-transporting) subunit E, partial [Deltaproteobacteria bacterium]|nr:NADH:ubiquinone reductase (Na(+)-transporting) subunit E [Deltaproteobacteria bacterium]
FVTTATTAINYGVYHHVLVPYGLTFLSFIVFIAVIAAFVQFVEMFIERFSLGLYHALGIFLPLITVNCAILGASLFMIIRRYTFLQSVAFGFGGGVGWTLAIILIAGLRQRMRYSDVPVPFRGVAIAMVITGVMAMAFMGFAGMVRIQ